MPSLSLSLASPPKLISPSLIKSPNHLSHRKLESSSSVGCNFELLRNRLSVQHLRKAISDLDLVAKQNTRQQLITYSLLLKACIRSRNFELGKHLHLKLTESGLELDSVLFNSLISLYSKCGEWEKAHILFEGMGTKRDLVSWSAIISCFAINKMEVEAIVVFLDMLKHGLYPNEYCFTAVIRSCSNAENVLIGKIILGFVIKTGYFDSDVCVGCALIDMFVKGSGDIDSACKVFNKMLDRNVVTWTLMITRLTQLGYSREAIELFLDMLFNGYTPDRFTLSSVVSAGAELESLSLGYQLHSWVIRSGLSSDVCVGCSLVDLYAKCTAEGSVENSRKVFDRMPDHNVMSWTAIITGYVQSHGRDKEAVELFCEMLKGHVTPNHFTFSGVLKAGANLSDPCLGEQLHTHTIKLGLASINCVGNSLINMYARSGRMEDARKAFDILFEKNLISYNTIVDAYAKKLNHEEAFELYHEIQDAGFGASSFTFASLLSGAASLGAIGKGEQIHARALKSGFGSDQCIQNALISMYSRCANLQACVQVFSDMGDRNVISWTAVITGFAKHGFATKALEMFHEMLETGVKPNEVTYIAVLSACSHVGLIDEGWKHFNSMQKKHGVIPRMEHYACMVDLLGRSGSLLEAIKFINSMPFKADALVWRTFLGSCRIHGNTELGEHAAKMILEQEPHDPAAYILLSNLYASAGKWEDVATIRKIMKEKNLIKEAGYSWIEVENKVHKFHVGDTSHPNAREIYDELDILALKIKKLGYVPDTDFVLHDVEDEQKEQYLIQHSEKIAVVFGLISTSKPKPITIFKNLRVCGDCHTAIKYISAATGREIVVRDASRFHHVKDGICSCNDYW
ncbi:Pentatricopeptide repeat-containing protein [Quillaja saponaria]|uniref:Pentatricopeptide repeat-containing protein n=1 Tax=Quillaja saponaria TaxID=32244 RepID=A0AAD7PC80_QUISA|nr:Pentatricopeptide repeat-containing protein [Quillaja saponaria]